MQYWNSWFLPFLFNTNSSFNILTVVNSFPGAFHVSRFVLILCWISSRSSVLTSQVFQILFWIFLINLFISCVICLRCFFLRLFSYTHAIFHEKLKEIFVNPFIEVGIILFELIYKLVSMYLNSHPHSYYIFMKFVFATLFYSWIVWKIVLIITYCCSTRKFACKNCKSNGRAT